MCETISHRHAELSSYFEIPHIRIPYLNDKKEIVKETILVQVVNQKII